MTDSVRPWHYFTHEHVDDAVQSARMTICIECPHYINLTKQCGICKCFMPAKTAIQDATCPDGKW
jgi:hypothetical protein